MIDAREALYDALDNDGQVSSFKPEQFAIRFVAALAVDKLGSRLPDNGGSTYDYIIQLENNE